MEYEAMRKKWQRQQLRDYDKLAANRLLRQAAFFLVVWAVMMTLAVAAVSKNY